ncbi:MAG: FHA domain-containing protein [Deltaproteobacteria bacterium]|nr:FHA domain-containing protein [Deltaproteobacteria bacterium]
MVDDLSFKLVIVDDEGKTTPVPLTRDEYTVGRQEGNVIRLTERNISRRHARFFCAKGHWIIEDLGSYNGVFVNSDRVKERHAIKSGDTIQIGDYRLIFREVSETDVEESVVIVDGDVSAMPPPRLTTAVPGEQPKLIIINGPEPGTIVSLQEGTTILGRGETCEVQVEDVSVSREHCSVELSAEYCRIRDMDSSNGVRINGMPRNEHYLQHGDTIEMGNILVRFVVAGAWDPLLDQLQIQAAAPVSASSRRALMIGLPLAILGLLIVVGVAVLLIDRGRDAQKEHAAEVSADELKTLSIDELIHRAQTSYDNEEWRKGISYAAEVLKYEPSNQRVKDLKETATYELEQQPHFEDGMKAYERKEWERAYRTFSKIGLESRYRSRPEVQQATSKFINQLMNEMFAAQSSKDWDKVEEKALIIESLPEVGDSQAREAKRLLKEARRVKGGGGKKSGTGSGGKKPSKTPPTPTIVNKGASSTPASTSTQDAIKDARKAILANDQKKCIAILQKAKTTPSVLDLLATCYKGAKQMDRYYATLKRYVSKYPTGPKAEKYRKILKDAGQL